MSVDVQRHPPTLPRPRGIDQKLLRFWDKVEERRDRDPRLVERIIDQALALFEPETPQETPQ